MEAFLIPMKRPKAGKIVLVDDALIGGALDRLERLVHEFGLIVRGGGLPQEAIKALVEAKIDLAGVLGRLNSALLEAEQDDKPTIGAGS